MEAFGWMGALGFCAAGPVGCWTWGLDEPAAVQSRMLPCSRPVVAGGLAFLVYMVLARPSATVVFYLSQGERPVMMIWSRSPTSVDWNIVRAIEGATDSVDITCLECDRPGLRFKFTTIWCGTVEVIHSYHRFET